MTHDSSHNSILYRSHNSLWMPEGDASFQSTLIKTLYLYSAGSTWTSKFIKKNSCLSCYLLSKFFHPPPFKKDFAHKVIINNKNNIRCQKELQQQSSHTFQKYRTQQNIILYFKNLIQAFFYLGYSYWETMLSELF